MVQTFPSPLRSRSTAAENFAARRVARLQGHLDAFAPDYVTPAGVRLRRTLGNAAALRRAELA
jgi:hypothetical protein